MREAGLGGGGFNTYRNVTVDNGSDISGKDATGDFVEVSYNDKDEREIKSFGKELTGVILSSKALLTFRDKTQTKKKVAESDEFNPLMTKKNDGAKALIPIYQLDFNGQRKKTPDGKMVVNYAFYDDLKTAKEKGVKNMDYTYTIVVYFLIKDSSEFDGEIIKVKFKGASRGNFFDFQKRIWKEGRLSAPKVKTKINTYVEKEYGKYAISFSPVLREDGQIEQIEDDGAIEEKIIGLVTEAQDRRSNFLPPNEENLMKFISEPQPTSQAQQQNIQQTPSQPQEDLPPVDSYNIEEEPDDELDPKNIPF